MAAYIPPEAPEAPEVLEEVIQLVRKQVATGQAGSWEQSMLKYLLMQLAKLVNVKDKRAHDIVRIVLDAGCALLLTSPHWQLMQEINWQGQMLYDLAVIEAYAKNPPDDRSILYMYDMLTYNTYACSMSLPDGFAAWVNDGLARGVDISAIRREKLLTMSTWLPDKNNIDPSNLIEGNAFISFHLIFDALLAYSRSNKDRLLPFLDDLLYFISRAGHDWRWSWEEIVTTMADYAPVLVASTLCNLPIPDEQILAIATTLPKPCLECMKTYVLEHARQKTTISAVVLKHMLLY